MLVPRYILDYRISTIMLVTIKHSIFKWLYHGNLSTECYCNLTYFTQE